MLNLPKEEFVYRDAELNMSKDAMANALYATIITKAEITSTFCLSYEYDRKQNNRNSAWLKVHIHPSMIDRWSIEAKTILKRPPVISGQ